MNFKRSKIWACSRLLATSFLGLFCAGVFLNLDKTVMVAHAEGRVFDGHCINRTNYDPQTGILTIPPGYTEIKNLGNRKGIKTVNIPASITKIGRAAFMNCSSLTHVNIEPNSELKTIDFNAFWGCTDLKTINLPDGLKEIGREAFNRCTSLTNIRIPSTVITIGDFAFGGTSLREISLPNQLGEIAFGTFSKCSSLEHINIPDCVKRIGNSAFSGCTSLKTIALPKELREIGDFAFSRCSLITDIDMPDTVLEIAHCVFADCASLRKVHLSENLQKIPYGTFRGCSSLEDISVPNKVREIEGDAFNGCISLTNIHFPESLEIIDHYALRGCDSLKSKIPAHTKIMDTISGGPFDLVIGRDTKIEKFTCGSQHKCDYSTNLSSGISTNVSGRDLVETTAASQLFRIHGNMPLPSLINLENPAIPDSETPFFEKTSKFNNPADPAVEETTREEQHSGHSRLTSAVVGVLVAVAALGLDSSGPGISDRIALSADYTHGSLPVRPEMSGPFSETRDPWAFLDGHYILKLGNTYHLM